MIRRRYKDLVLGTGLLVAFLVLNAAVSYRNTRQLDEDARWVAHTHEVLDALEELLGTVRDAETGQRGYLLTGDAAYLAPYEHAAATWEARIDRVRLLTADNPRQQDRLPRVRDLIAARMAVLKRGIERTREGPADARRFVLSGEGHKLMAAIRAQVREMEDEERSLLAERQATSHRSYVAAAGSGGVAALLGMTAVGAFAWLMNRYLRDAIRGAAALAAEQERFRATFEQAAVGIAHVSPDGRWLRVNRRLCEITGYSHYELLGLTFQAITHPDDLKADLGHVRRLLAGEISTYSMDKRYVRKDGSPVWVNLTVSLVRRPADDPAYFISVIEDVSERKRLEAEVARYAGDLERRVAERTRELEDANAALETFAETVSHDLRAPLRNVQGLARVLAEDAADRLDPPGRDNLDRIAGAARRMDRLTLDLLAYSRLGRGEMHLGQVDLGGVVDEARAGLEDEIRDAAGRVTVDGSLPPVAGHRPTLVQMATNLLDNAVKFRSPGRPPVVRVWAEDRGGRVRLWVEDNGIGLPPGQRDRIFEPFERLHGEEAYPGTGIGLAIVRKGAERMGGRAGVESVPGRGSRFLVELPRFADGG